MKKLIAVLLILASLTSVACAANLEETIENYNYYAEATRVPKITQIPTDGTYVCFETGMLLMFLKSETSDDIDLISCTTFGQPYGEGFLLTVCTLLDMADSSNSMTNYGRMLKFFMIAKNSGSAILRTDNGCTGQITYKPEQYTFFIELK